MTPCKQVEDSDWPMLRVEELSTYYPNQEMDESTFQRVSADGEVAFTLQSEPSTCFTANFVPGSTYDTQANKRGFESHFSSKASR